MIRTTRTRTTRTALALLYTLGFLCPTRTLAFGTLSIPAPQYVGDLQQQQADSVKNVPQVTEHSAPWRIVLNIGREPLANGMPFNWARSGCRMPLVIPCSFNSMTSSSSSDNTNSNNKNRRTTTTTNTIEPLSETVSFTGEDGAVVRPVQAGTWQLDDNQRQVTFDLTFPETLQRRDVTIAAGSTISCVGTIYTARELKRLNDEFYQAREDTWAIGGELNNMMDRQGAPKKWNEETQQWEKRFANENPLNWAQKQMVYWKSKATLNAKNRQRPNLNMLSAQGYLPGCNMNDEQEGVFFAKEGVVRGPNGAVMGKWSAEPINNRPISYR